MKFVFLLSRRNNLKRGLDGFELERYLLFQDPSIFGALFNTIRL